MNENIARFEFHPKGSKASEIISLTQNNLKEDFKDYEILNFDYKSFGILESILISIAGTVGSHIVIKLIENLLKYKGEKQANIEIKIIHVEHNHSFFLPDDKNKCIEYFKNSKNIRHKD